MGTFGTVEMVLELLDVAHFVYVEEVE